MQLDFRDDQTKMRGKNRLCLLDRHPVTLLLFSAGRNPILHRRGVTRIQVLLKAQVPELSAQLADIACHSPSGEMARAPAILQPGLAKIWTIKLVDVCTAGLITMMHKPYHVDRRSLREAGGSRKRRGTDGTGGQKLFKVQTQAALLHNVLRATDIRVELNLTFLEGRTLWGKGRERKKENKMNKTKKTKQTKTNKRNKTENQQGPQMPASNLKQKRQHAYKAIERKSIYARKDKIGR